MDGVGSTNTTFEDDTIKPRVERFFEKHCLWNYPENVTNCLVLDDNYEESVGKICENGAIQTMNQTTFVEGCDDMKNITLLHAYCVLHEKGYCHFPNADDVFICDGKRYFLSKVWERVFDEDGNVKGYKSIARDSKGYPRISKTMYTFKKCANGLTTVLKKYEFFLRVHVYEKYQMVHRLMTIGVPRDYMLDPYEKLWYLVLKHGKYVRGRKKDDPKLRGVTIRHDGKWITLEVSHLDHGMEGLNFLRIETKDMNLSRVVKCFSTINCRECGEYEIQGNCTHNPICHNTYEILCPSCCVIKLKE